MKPLAFILTAGVGATAIALGASDTLSRLWPSDMPEQNFRVSENISRNLLTGATKSGQGREMLAQATVASPSAASNAEQVDETALRYFARQGDQRRLEAEIARLRALYPQWTPPANPLDIPPNQDTRLDEMWLLYSEGDYPGVRKAIADRQAAEPQWQVPADLLDRLALGEARQQLVNASDLKQYDTVIRLGAQNPSMLTCGDVDVLWRVAEAFARTDRAQRARDAYLYVLNNCPGPDERLATVQKASEVLPRADLDALLALEKTVDGKREFQQVRDDLARRSVAAGNADARITAPAQDLATVERLAGEQKLTSDYLLLGWYYVQRREPARAERWFRLANEQEPSVTAAQGLALALVELGRPAEAEAFLYDYRGENDEVRAVYLAAATNLLAIVPPVAIPLEVLQRMSAEIAAARNVNGAQQLGWYADALYQYETAALWFGTALGFDQNDEPSAYGLALMRWKLGDVAGVAEMQRIWAGRSARIARVGQPEPDSRQTQQPAVAYATPPSAYPVAPTVPAAEPKPFAPRTVYPATPPSSAPVAAAPAPAQTIYPPVAMPQTLPQTPYPQGVQQPGAVLAQPNPERFAQPPQVVAVRPAPQAGGQETVVLQQAPAARPVQRTAQRARPAAREPRRADCSTTVDASTLSPRAALDRGWCLMDINRPMEAAAAFEVGLRNDTEEARRDAAYGQSLAYLRLGLSDEAALSAAKAPQSRSRTLELQAALLSEKATGHFEAERYTEALMALDERARIVPESIDLMVLRGYAYLNLKRFGDADQVFRAAAGTGDREAIRGIASVKAARGETGN
jgi:tetratricopeptide (TPR) repeat protein